jgi:hypothetical protein
MKVFRAKLLAETEFVEGRKILISAHIMALTALLSEDCSEDSWLGSGYTGTMKNIKNC